jgi:hypothetical protein
MTTAEWIALLLTLAFISMILAHSAGVVNVEKWITSAGTYLLKAVTLSDIGSGVAAVATA